METQTLRKKPDSDANDVFKAHLNNFTFSKAGWFFFLELGSEFFTCPNSRQYKDATQDFSALLRWAFQ